MIQKTSVWIQLSAEYEDSPEGWHWAVKYGDRVLGAGWCGGTVEDVCDEVKRWSAEFMDSCIEGWLIYLDQQPQGIQ